MTTRLAIQLVTWNDSRYIPYLFASLKKQTYRDWQLLVWDNDSHDDTVALIEKGIQPFPVPVSITKHTADSGFAVGHNRLFQKHTSEYILLLNPDMYLDADSIEKMVAFLDAHSNVAAVSPRLMRWDFQAIGERGIEASFTDDIDTLGMKVFRSRRVSDQATKQSWPELKHRYATGEAVPVFGVSGALPMYRRAALLDIAFQDGTFFDESYVAYKEDVDVAFRLQAQGYSSYILPHTVAYHDRTGAGPRELGDRAAAANKAHQNTYVKYYSYKNHLATLYKNEYWQNLVLDLPWILWYEWKKFVWFLLFDRSVIVGLKEVFRDRKILREHRKSIQNKRKMGWKEIRKWWR